MLQMDSKLPLEVFEKVLQLAIEGCKAIYNIMLQEVENYSQTLLKCKGISSI